MPQTTLQNMSAATTSDITVRRHLKDGDADAIAELHRRVDGSEYGLNEQFVDGVRRGLAAAVASGWPQRRGRCGSSTARRGCAARSA